MSRRVVIIGGGLTGLSAAVSLGREAVLLEGSAEVGGLCRSYRRDGWMMSLVPWEAIGLGVIRAESGIYRLNIYVGSLTLEAELWGPMGERAM